MHSEPVRVKMVERTPEDPLLQYRVGDDPQVPAHRKIVHGGRYDYRAIVLRIERMRVACGVPVKELYGAVGIAQSQWSKKMIGELSTFSYKEAGDIADFFSFKLGKPLVGWPFVDAEVSDLLERR